MEAKVESLENELADVRSSLTAVENVVKDLPGALIAMIERSSGKSLQVSEGNILNSGLNLAIAKQIILLHEGTLSASNHATKGGYFLITLPISLKTQKTYLDSV
jgi:light-regulated signal transduction histidine kinase (bacteriophytochrome)